MLCCDPEEEREYGLFKELQLMPFSSFLLCWIIAAMLTKLFLIAWTKYLNSAIWERAQPQELRVEERVAADGWASHGMRGANPDAQHVHATSCVGTLPEEYVPGLDVP